MSTKIMIIFGAEDHKMYQILVPMNPTKKMSAKWEVVALGSLTLLGKNSFCRANPNLLT